MPLVACDLFRRDGYDSIMAAEILRYVDEQTDDATEGFPPEAADAPST